MGSDLPIQTTKRCPELCNHYGSCCSGHAFYHPTAIFVSYLLLVFFLLECYYCKSISWGFVTLLYRLNSVLVVQVGSFDERETTCQQTGWRLNFSIWFVKSGLLE